MHNRVPILSLLIAGGVSHFGNMMTFIAIPWFVLELTGSPGLTGITAAAAAIPMVIGATFGGVFVDRVGFKRFSILADVVSGVMVGVIPLIHLTVGITFWQLLLLVFLGAILDTPGYAARTAMLPDLAKLGGMQLERVNSATSTIAHLATLLGPPLAGILIAIIGTTPVLWVNTGTFIVSALLIAAAVPAIQRSGEAREERPGTGYLADLREGFQFVRRDRLIFALITTLAVTNFLDAHIIVILPVYANDVLESAVSLGLMFSAFGAGALVGALGFGVFGEKLPRRAVFVGAFAVGATAFWMLATLPPLIMILAVLAVVGVAFGPVNPLIATVFQERTPKSIRGRVFGLIDATAFIAIAPGRVLAGYLIEWIGIQMTLVLVGGTYVAVVVTMFLNSGLRGSWRTD